MLRAAREKQGLHIAALAAAIKVSPRKLDALENDRWHELPDATFVRALAQTVCRSLKIEARPVLALLPITGEVALEPVSNALNQPFHDRPGRDGGGFGASAIRPMVATGLLLLLAALAVYFLPASLWSPRPAATGVAAPASAPALAAPPAAAAASEPAPGQVADASAPAVATSPTFAAEPVAPAASTAPAASFPAANNAAVLVPAPPQATAAVPAAPVAPAPASAAAAAGVLQLRTSQASWVDVRDARGTVLLSRTVAPGEAVGLDGALPLRLTIGNAASTQLSFRGRAVDLTGRVRENVARLELQ